jgi:hypothetical protein
MAITEDRTWFEDFVNKWLDGTLTDDHPVVVMTKELADIVAWRYRRPDRADDLKQMALIRLHGSGYKGSCNKGDRPCSLRHFTMRILLQLNTGMWDGDGGNSRDELQEEEKSDSLILSPEAAQQVFADSLIQELLTTGPELRRRIVAIIVSEERRPGARLLVKKLNQGDDDEHQVTRHQVEAALGQLEDVLARHYPERAALKAERKQRASRRKAKARLRQRAGINHAGGRKRSAVS